MAEEKTMDFSTVLPLNFPCIFQNVFYIHDSSIDISKINIWESFLKHLDQCHTFVPSAGHNLLFFIEHF